jgi:CHAT domain-containing protein
MADLEGATPRIAEVAYLAACQTAMGDVSLADESMHLAGSMQLVGFRHVVASMFYMRDDVAPLLARSFYSSLLADGVPDSQHAARALHAGVAELHKRFPEDPLAWAPFIHVGP